MLAVVTMTAIVITLARLMTCIRFADAVRAVAGGWVSHTKRCTFFSPADRLPW